MIKTWGGRARVILIGGAPCSGKGTVARLLAARVGYDVVSTDDLGAAARAVTSSGAQPALHPMSGMDYREYYVRRPVEELWRDALRAHRALWPAIESVVTQRSTWGAPAVVEGWAILPDLVQGSNFSQTIACWLLLDPDILAERIRRDPGFTRGAADVDQLVEAFTARSRRYNDYAEERGGRHVLRVERDSPEEICDRIVELERDVSLEDH